jgi:SAM-dependent methyltransferase
MDRFLELYGNLPRAGPGDDGSTRRALAALPGLPAAGCVLDLGCGPGRQTGVLLGEFGGTLVAVDILAHMLRRAKRFVGEAGLGDRLRCVQADMHFMPFANESFDAIWSEGAIYNLGFRRGLEALKPLLKPGGYLAVTEAVWLKPDRPEELVEFWRAYPEIDTIGNKLRVIGEVGLGLIDHFTLPASSWTNEYYEPLSGRIADVEADWKGIPEAEQVLQEARHELDMFEKYAEYYGYAFFVMRRQD